jgi:Carboxypeptidase regulatory-like domain
VLSAEDATVADYEETQNVITNEFGLYALQIGSGTPTASFTALGMTNVKWETGNKYIRVAIDPKGGSDYAVIGTTQLLSVPYAMYADKAGMARETTSAGGTRAGAVSTSAAGTGTANYLTKFTAANTIDNSQVFDNGTNIGIGTTAPASHLHITTNTAAPIEHLRMENTSSTGSGKFIMYNDNSLNYHTFTKYGSAVPGVYGGNTLFPYANLLAFGSNNSSTVMANGANIGFATVNGGNAYFKFIGVQATGNVGLGGNATPTVGVHINRTDAASDTVKITNNTTGHTSTDGLDIRTTGNAAEIINRENASLAFGTNNTESMRIDALGNIGIGTTTPTVKLEVAGQVKISGGAPGSGKVLTSDAAGLASWQTPSAPVVTGTITGFVRLFDPYGNGVYTNLANTLVSIDGTSTTTNTDAFGKFTFTNLPAGTYALTATKAGYGTDKLPWVSLVGGTTPAYVGSIKLSQIPTFNANAIAVSNTAGTLTVGGTVNGATTYKRTVGLFIGNTASVSSNPANYIAFQSDNIAAAANAYSFTLTPAFLAGLGIPSGSIVYFIAYSINLDNANSSAYTDLITGRKVYTALGSAPTTVASIVMP